MKGLKRLREGAGLTQQQVAARVGVTTPAVTHWEVGDRDPGLRYIVKLKELFNCTYDELLADANILNNEEGEINGAEHPEHLQVREADCGADAGALG